MIPPPAVPPLLWRTLEEQARTRTRANDPAHDFSHVERVVANGLEIARCEGLEPLTAGAVALAALLHELFTLPKDHVDSARAGDVCAEHARELLVREGAPSALVSEVCDAICDHSFSKGVVPAAMTSRVLQDADRLDAIGAIGLARMWATCADMKRPFYCPRDPFCTDREPDDKAWGLDHVFHKLLKISDRLHTATARRMAEGRAAFLRSYLRQLQSEVQGHA